MNFPRNRLTWVEMANKTISQFKTLQQTEIICLLKNVLALYLDRGVPQVFLESWLQACSLLAFCRLLMRYFRVFFCYFSGFLCQWTMSWRCTDICLQGTTKEFIARSRTILVSLQPGGRSRDTTVGIATDYGLDDRGIGVRVSVGSRIFSSPQHPDRLWGPPNLLSNGYRWLFLPGVKRPGREIDNSPKASAEFKKMWIYTPTPNTPSWRSAYLVKHRDNFTFLHPGVFRAWSWPFTPMWCRG
jgi:hypothetical protein